MPQVPLYVHKCLTDQALTDSEKSLVQQRLLFHGTADPNNPTVITLANADFADPTGTHMLGNYTPGSPVNGYAAWYKNCPEYTEETRRGVICSNSDPYLGQYHIIEQRLNGEDWELVNVQFVANSVVTPFWDETSWLPSGDYSDGATMSVTRIVGEVGTVYHQITEDTLDGIWDCSSSGVWTKRSRTDDNVMSGFAVPKIKLTVPGGVVTSIILSGSGLMGLGVPFGPIPALTYAGISEFGAKMYTSNGSEDPPASGEWFMAATQDGASFIVAYRNQILVAQWDGTSSDDVTPLDADGWTLSAYGSGSPSLAAGDVTSDVVAPLDHFPVGTDPETLWNVSIPDRDATLPWWWGSSDGASPLHYTVFSENGRWCTLAHGSGIVMSHPNGVSSYTTAPWAAPFSMMWDGETFVEVSGNHEIGGASTVELLTVTRGNLSAAAALWPTGSHESDTYLLKQALLSGGEIHLSGGVYLVSEELEIGSDTFLHGDGVTLRKASSIVNILRNSGALTGATNSRIRIRGIRFEAGGYYGVSPVITGLRGMVSMLHIRDFTIEDCEFPDILTPNWGLHLADWENVVVTRCRFEGTKDGIHISAGRDAVISLCRFKTYDDGIALNAHDYYDCSPKIGSISNILITGCTDEYRDAGQSGYFCRLLTGAGAPHSTSNSYRAGDWCSANGKNYICESPANGTTVSAAGDTAPSHSAGSATAASGLVWRYNGTGTTVVANIADITFRDCRVVSDRTFARLEWSLVDKSRSIMPGSENLATISNVLIDGGKYQPATGRDMLAGEGSLTDITVIGMKITQGSGYVVNLQPTPGYTNTTDPRGAHTARILLRGCRFDGNAKYFLANRQNLTLDASEQGGYAEGGALTRHATSTGSVRLRTENVLADITGVVGTNGDRVLTANGVRELQWGRWMTVQNPHPETRVLQAQIFAYSGANANAVQLDGGGEVYAGTAAGGYGQARFARFWNSYAVKTSYPINFDIPFTLSFELMGQVTAASGGALRMVIGVPDTTPPRLADVAAFGATGAGDKGVGIEIGTTGSNQAARLIYYSGGVARQSAWWDMGVAPAMSRRMAFVLVNMGGGVYRLYASTTAGNSVPAIISESAVCSITDGPTGDQADYANRWCGLQAVAHTTTVPAANSIYGLLLAHPILVL